MKILITILCITIFQFFSLLSSGMTDSFQISKWKFSFQISEMKIQFLFISLWWYGQFFSNFKNKKFHLISKMIFFKIFHDGINEIFSRPEVAKII
jgi:murein L,D-transpeptidase YafK